MVKVAYLYSLYNMYVYHFWAQETPVDLSVRNWLKQKEAENS